LFNEPEPAGGEPEVERELAEMLAQAGPPVESWRQETGNWKSETGNQKVEI